MFRFIHSSDLHIGKRFGNLPEDLRGRLREARHTAIDRLAEHARAAGSASILLAGDTFDTETPPPAVMRQALAAMAGHDTLRWVVLPGNHDSLLADELWNAMRSAVPANVVLATEPSPILLQPGIMLLPAPCTTRRPGRDLTQWMDEFASDTGVLRIGVAHGPIQSFSENGVAADVIAPDRAARARLDYLALGDWHGQLRVTERTWYSGSPEPDRFKHRRPGQALLVSLAGSGAVPEVTPIDTGSFEWRTVDLALLGDEDAASMLSALMRDCANRRQVLLRIAASGRIRIAARTALGVAFEEGAPEFAHAEFQSEELETVCESTDLDLIDHAGALRQAAETLLMESKDDARPLPEREIARDALVRLFTYCEAMQRA